MRSIIQFLLVSVAAWLGVTIAIEQSLYKFHNNYAVLILQHKDGDFVAKDTDREREQHDFAKRMAKEVPKKVQQ